MELRPILLVEDDPNDVELTLLALERLRLANQVLNVRDGVEALDYLRRRGDFVERAPGNPAVIVLDNKMPRLDGLAVLREVRRDPELGLIPVVMLTSSREEQDVLASYRLGSNAYIVKPIGSSNFLQAIQQLGLFWGMLNEPPPGSVKPSMS